MVATGSKFMSGEAEANPQALRLHASHSISRQKVRHVEAAQGQPDEGGEWNYTTPPDQAARSLEQVAARQSLPQQCCILFGRMCFLKEATFSNFRCLCNSGRFCSASGNLSAN